VRTDATIAVIGLSASCPGIPLHALRTHRTNSNAPDQWPGALQRIQIGELRNPRLFALLAR
jgi:hypothetical protein